MKAELPGIMRKIVEAWLARRARGGTFLPPHPQAQAKLVQAISPLSEFFGDCLEKAPNEVWNGSTVPEEWLITPSSLFALYQAHCQMVGRTGVFKKQGFLEVLKRPPYSVKGGEHIRSTPSRRRGYAVRVVDTEVTEALFEADPKLRESLMPRVKQTPFKSAAAAEPPLDEPVEIVDGAKNSKNK